MDWGTFTQLWGPAVPMFGIFVWYLHRLIFRTVPRGFRTLRIAIDHAESKANERHQEAMAVLMRVEKNLCDALKTTGKKKAPPTKRG